MKTDAPSGHGLPALVRGKKMVILWINFRTMPIILKLLTFHAAFCIIFLSAVIPWGRYEMYGKEISYLEFWRSGASLVTILTGILLPMSAYLMLKRNKMAREFYVGSICLLLMLSLSFEVAQDRFEMIVPGAVSLGLLGLLIAYLYLRKPVRRYFEPPLTIGCS